MTAHAALSSTGGMQGLLGTGSTAASAALTGTGTVETSLFRLFSGVSGPATPTPFTGGYGAGITFEITTSASLHGYSFWTPTGGDTVAREFVLWHVTSSGAGTLVAGCTVTSGTLTAGAWTDVLLVTPVALTTGFLYTAACAWTAVTGFPFTANQFGSGDPFSAGIVSGPITAYSDFGGSNPVPSSWTAQGPFQTASSDPTTTFPANGFESSNLWMDVIIG
jgi:hypothetical protein